MKKDSKNNSSSSKASNSKTSKNSSSSSKTASKAGKSSNSSSNSSSSSKSNKKTKKNKKANDDNDDDDDDDNINDDEVVTSLSSDTIKFLEMLAMRLPHKSPSSSSSLQLMMAACDAIQGTEVATEIASNPKHSLQIFEEAFSKKDEEIQHDNNDDDSIDNDNIVTLINTNKISQLISINDNNNNITIDSLISIVNKNNFHNDHQKLVQHLITYHNNHRDTGTLSKFVNILSQKLSSYIVFSSNDDSDTNGDDIESDSCMWAYVTVMSITNNNTANTTKIISTLHLLAIDNPEASFMCMGYLGYWGIRLSSNDYDDSNMQLLIQSITSLLNSYLQSIHMKASSDPGIDIEMLILSPVVLYCWLSKLKGSSSSLNSFKDLLLSYLIVVAQSTANVWSTLHTILKDTDSIKIDKDITNRGYEIGKKGLKELLSWICSKAGLLDSACAAMTEGLMPTIAPTKTAKKSKKGEETSSFSFTMENDEIDDENDDADDDDDDDEPLTFSIDNTRDDSILKSLENDENYTNEEPNELEQELKKAQEQQMKKKKKKTTSSNDDAGNDGGNDKKKRKVR